MKETHLNFLMRFLKLWWIVLNAVIVSPRERDALAFANASVFLSTKIQISTLKTYRCLMSAVSRSCTAIRSKCSTAEYNRQKMKATKNSNQTFSQTKMDTFTASQDSEEMQRSYTNKSRKVKRNAYI